MKHLKNFSLFENANLDLNKLKSELESFRKDMEDRNEWSDDKTCFRGMCQHITEELRKHLVELGYKPERIGGYYVGASCDFYPNTDDWDVDDVEEFNDRWESNDECSDGLEFKHWWIELDGYIVDLTEDQFHPDEEDDYRIGIYKKPDGNYKSL